MTRYVVIGAGAVGATTAAQLHLAGREVVLVARGAHLAALRETGLRHVRPDGTVLRTRWTRCTPRARCVRTRPTCGP